MHYNINITQNELELIQAGLDLLNTHIITSIGGMNELNNKLGEDGERNEMIKNSEHLIKDIENLNNTLDIIQEIENKPDFVKRKMNRKKNKKS